MKVEDSSYKDLSGAGDRGFFGIFDCYSPGRGCVPTLVLSGVFGVDDLYRVSIEVDNFLREQGKVSYYGPWWF